MTKSKLVTEVALWLFPFAVLLYAWRPDYYQVAFAAGVVSILASIYTAVRATPAEREQSRGAAWLIPVATLVLAAQMVYSATPEYRMRAMLLGAGLIAVGFVLFALRRRAT